MTGGKVVILGATGMNLAAGMSGGIAYVVDLDIRLVNKGMVHTEPLEDGPEAEEVRKLIEEHYITTRSEKAMEILAQWHLYRARITKIIPNDYQAMQEKIAKYLAEGKTQQEAEMLAFKS